jgi:two-component system response regulator YesN
MHKLLIVDDDQIIRAGMQQSIEWEDHGIRVIGTASNGRECLEMIPECLPDIILTDIKMPFMDGLELGEKLREIMPSTKLIIFSGFDDFEYAQKAIKINVAEYVLKPINSNELTETLKKLKKQRIILLDYMSLLVKKGIQP